MKLMVLTTCNNIIDGQQKTLEDSLIKHGYDYEIFLYGFIFGKQYEVIKTWSEQYQGDATHVLYTDCYDTLALAPPTEVIIKFEAMRCKMLISTEKACFPNDPNHTYHRDFNYTQSPTVWKFINGGGCLFELAFFKDMCNKYPIVFDPEWLAQCLLENPNKVKLDYQCEIFQCLSHSNKDEWELYISRDNDYVPRLRNKLTKTTPIFFHGNGRTNMDWVKIIATEQFKSTK